jgi:hypothetical protein
MIEHYLHAGLLGIPDPKNVPMSRRDDVISDSGRTKVHPIMRVQS